MDLMEKYLSRVKPEGRKKELKSISDRLLDENIEVDSDGGICKTNIENDIQSVPETKSKAINVTTETEVTPTVGKLCTKCGKPGQRFCYGESHSGKYVYAQFCLECYPHHF